MVFAVAAVEAVCRPSSWSRLSTLATLGSYLVERFSTMTAGAEVDPNIAVRTNLYSVALKTIQKDGLVLGILAPVGQAAGVYFLDSYWAQALVSLGLLGTFCVALLALNALVQAGRAAFEADGDVAHFGLAVFLGLADGPAAVRQQRRLHVLCRGEHLRGRGRRDPSSRSAPARQATAPTGE